MYNHVEQERAAMRNAYCTKLVQLELVRTCERVCSVVEEMLRREYHISCRVLCVAFVCVAMGFLLVQFRLSLPPIPLLSGQGGRLCGAHARLLAVCTTQFTLHPVLHELDEVF